MWPIQCTCSSPVRPSGIPHLARVEGLREPYVDVVPEEFGVVSDGVRHRDG